MEFLTSSILGGIVWDSLKKFGQVTADNLREPLKKWLLTDTDISNIANIVNETPSEFKKTEKFIAAFLDDNEEIKKILKKLTSNSEASTVINQQINGNNNYNIGTLNGNIITGAYQNEKKY
mgnify:CR=1 FL=1